MTDTNTEQVLVSWEAPIHPRHDRTKRWYILTGGIILGVAAYGILSGAWSVSVVALLCGAMYFLVRDHESAAHKITLNRDGVLLEERFTRWEDMEGFWFLITPDYTELHLVPRNKRRNDIHIQTGNQSVTELRTMLGQFLSEFSDRHETLLDFVARYCKL